MTQRPNMVIEITRYVQFIGKKIQRSVTKPKLPQATGGEYNILFDSEQGLIVPTLSYGPAWQIEKGNVRKTWPQGAPLPDLRQWSDIAYLTWIQYSTNENRQKLSMVVNVDCESELTRSIVVEALKKDGVKSGIPPKCALQTFPYGMRTGTDMKIGGQAIPSRRASAKHSCLRLMDLMLPSLERQIC